MSNFTEMNVLPFCTLRVRVRHEHTPNTSRLPLCLFLGKAKNGAEEVKRSSEQRS